MPPFGFHSRSVYGLLSSNSFSADHLQVILIQVSLAKPPVVKRKPDKNSGLSWIRTFDLCDTSALYQLSYQANWEMVALTL